MKKILFKLIAMSGMLVAMSATVNAQWTRNAGTLQTYLTNTGDNVGIGTTNPIYKLDVRNAGIATMQFKSNTENANILLDKGATNKVASLNYRTAGVTNWQTGCVQNSNYTIRNFNTSTVVMHFDYVTNNVGIGTEAPAAKLDINGPGNWDLSNTQGDVRIGNATYNIRFGIALAGGGAGYSTIAATTALQLGTGSTYPNLNTLSILGGQVGVGTGTPTAKLDVAGTVAINNNQLRLRAGTDDAHILKYDTVINGPLLSGFDGGALGGTYPNATILQWTWDGATGRVGIGTSTPSYKLDVCGTIRATEVRIETGWCDYVFANDYKLKSIDDVAAFINDHKHLPGIVPASEVEKEGMKVGEMSKAMMEKIEELTLYLIDQNNQIKELKKQNQLQQQQIDNLKK